MQSITEQEAYKDLAKRQKTAMMSMIRAEEILWMAGDTTFSDEYRKNILREIKRHLTSGVSALSGRC